MRHTKDDKLSSTILNVKEYLRELHSISRFRIYHRDASSDRSARSRELVASHVIARNVEFMNLRATARTIEVGQAHCQDSCPRKKKKKKKERRGLAPKKAHVRAFAKSISAKGYSGRSNETDGQAATVRPPTSRVLRISNQLLPRQLKLNVLSTHPASPLPSPTTTIVNTTNVVVMVVVVAAIRTPRVLAVHGLQLRRALYEQDPLSIRGPSHPATLSRIIGPQGKRGRFGRLRKCAAPRRADALSALI